MDKKTESFFTYCKKNNLEKLLKEWHPTKNGSLKPNDFTYGSHAKVWWICDKGHEWEGTIKSRTNQKYKSNCPYCSNRKILKGYNDLESKFPEVAKQWHPTKNGDLKPSNVSYGSTKRVWWICEKGHEWEAKIYDRTKKNGSKCHCCANKKVWKGFNDLETKYPELAKQWHPTKNGDLKPSDILPGSHKDIWWLCEKGHEWVTWPNNRTGNRNNGCPYCANKKIQKGFNDLATKFPDITKQWHPTKNEDLTPFDVAPQSNKKVWWLCEKGHEWEASIDSRTGKKRAGCGVCSNKLILRAENDFETTHPEIAKLWHPTKNGDLKPSDLTYGSGTKVWWMCNKGHEWKSSPNRMTQPGRNTCPECSKWRRTSFPEKAIYFYVKKVFKDALSNHNCDIVKNKELDIYIPSIRVAIEYDGERYHTLKNLNSDINKNTLCANGDILIIRVREENCPKINNSENVIILEQKAGDLSHLNFNIKKIFSILEEKLNKDILCPVIDINLDTVNILELIEFEEKENSLFNKFPEIAKQWHPTKNGALKPQNISYGASRKVWWECDKGHEWRATVASRTGTHKNNCPYCSRKIILTGETDLATLFPEIAKQWHPTKNPNYTPNTISSQNHTKVWWLCENGHEYQATVGSRTYMKTNCPYCSNKKVLRGYNDLETKYPDIAKQWHPTKNGDLKPFNISYRSGKKVWWLCENGHEYKRTVSLRTQKDGNMECPYCSNVKVLSGHNDLTTTHPQIAKQWHPTKNGDLKPSDFSYGSGAKVWWLCENGHEWKNVISFRTKNNSDKCPYCSNEKVLAGYNDLTTTHPQIAKYWHPTKNGDLKPSDFSYGSNKKIWWLCENGHEWELAIQYAVEKTDICSYCNNLKLLAGYNDLETTHSELAKQWHPIKNGDLKPSDVTSRSGKKVWWLCEKGHEWQASITYRANYAKTNCPYCTNQQVWSGFNDLETKYPEIAKQWHPTKNGGLKPSNTLCSGSKKAWWLCEHGHEWETKVYSRTMLKTGCPYCANKKIWKGFNDFETTHPELTKQWHPTKNSNLKPSDFSYGSGKEVWWRCENGHEWKATINSRTNSVNSKCSYCKEQGL